MSGPPKQMLVGMRSGIRTVRRISPSGETVVISPLTSVATQMFPEAVTARLSSRR